MGLVSALANENDGAGGGGEELFFGSVRSQSCTGSVEVAHHDGEGLAVAVLAFSEALDGGFVGGIDAEMEAADAFDGEDLARGDEGDGLSMTGSVGGDWAAPSQSTSESCGPQTQQALGCAWKRRLAGSSYSAWQSGHILKRAIEVCGRS